MMIEAWLKSGNKVFINSSSIIAVEDAGKDDSGADLGSVIHAEGQLEFVVEDLVDEVLEQLANVEEV